MKTGVLIGCGAALVVGGTVFMILSVTGGREHERTPVVDNTPPPVTVSTSVPSGHTRPPDIRLPDRSHALKDPESCNKSCTDQSENSVNSV